MCGGWCYSAESAAVVWGDVLWWVWSLAGWHGGYGVKQLQRKAGLAGLRGFGRLTSLS